MPTERKLILTQEGENRPTTFYVYFDDEITGSNIEYMMRQLEADAHMVFGLFRNGGYEEFRSDYDRKHYKVTRKNETLTITSH